MSAYISETQFVCIVKSYKKNKKNPNSRDLYEESLRNDIGLKIRVLSGALHVLASLNIDR